MFKLHVLQAQFGDSLMLEYGISAKPRYILIDGGPPGNYAADLQAALARDPGIGGELDLLVASHIDNDHIVGILDLLADIEDDLVSGRPLRLRIARLWYNSFEQTLDRDGELTQQLRSIMSMAGAANLAMPLTADAFYGVREGNRLRLAAQKLKITPNSGFKDGLIAVETAPRPISFGPLELCIVGPSRAALGALRKKWMEWLVQTSQAVASRPDMTAMIDRSVPNLSSIVLLASCDNKTILLTGDARGDHILAGLKAAGLAEQGRLHVDVLKVPHHGSSRNSDEKFFRSLTADIYVISANGKYGNPDFETLQWIVAGDKKRSRAITLFVTNETESTRSLRNLFDPKAYNYELKILEPGAHGHVLTLAD
jgi:beta-lactamase superfamily II metal-dependent hydrolase